MPVTTGSTESSACVSSGSHSIRSSSASSRASAETTGPVDDAPIPWTRPAGPLRVALQAGHYVGETIAQLVAGKPTKPFK